MKFFHGGILIKIWPNSRGYRYRSHRLKIHTLYTLKLSSNGLLFNYLQLFISAALSVCLSSIAFGILLKTSSIHLPAGFYSPSFPNFAVFNVKTACVCLQCSNGQVHSFFVFIVFYLLLRSVHFEFLFIPKSN